MSDNTNPTVVDGSTQPEDTGHTTTPTGAERTFTQADVDRIIGERLARSKAEYAAKEAALEQERYELQARDLMKQKGLPDELRGILKATDMEGLAAAVSVLEGYYNRPSDRGGADPSAMVLPPMYGGTGRARMDMMGGDEVRNAMGLNRR